MDWSIGQDDEVEGNVRSGVSSPGAPGESTVVVDPVSQIPAPNPRFRREPVEKTEVLKGRRVDELRAEVQRKRKAQQRQQHKRLALWGAAGAGAVVLGALLAGLVFSDSSGTTQGPKLSESQRLVAPPATEETSGPTAVQEAVPARPIQAQQAVVEEESPEPAENVASEAGLDDVASRGLSLDDLPSE